MVGFGLVKVIVVGVGLVNVVVVGVVFDGCNG